MEVRKLKRFPDGVLEYISKLIGEYLTGSEIGRLIARAGHPHIRFDGGTKWRFLYRTLRQFNEASEDGPYHVANILETFCDPTQPMWIGHESYRKAVMNGLNKGLVHVGIQLDSNGDLVMSQQQIIYVTDEEKEAITITPVFRERTTKVEKDLCFILMPFRPQFNRLYRDVIKQAIEHAGYRCLRADDLFSPKPVIEDIWLHIFKSTVIIADVTNRNPNVFYEMGIAHTLGRPVIIITQDEADVPFDVAYIRFFKYTDDLAGWETLRQSLAQALTTI